MDEKIIYKNDTDAIVIMLKEKPDGLFTSELGVFRTEEHKEYLSGAFAIEAEGGYKVFLKLTTERDALDWEFDAIFDYYDEETVLGEAEEVTEAESCHNPTWDAAFSVTDENLIQDKLLAVLKLHFLELQSVYEAILDKEEGYKTE